MNRFSEKAWAKIWKAMGKSGEKHSRQREEPVEGTSDICDVVNSQNNVEDRVAENSEQENGGRRWGEGDQTT